MTLGCISYIILYFLFLNIFSAYEPTNQYDLYDAFMHAINENNSLALYRDFNFTEYYRTWVNEPGYPILYVNVNHTTGDIALRQVIHKYKIML